MFYLNSSFFLCQAILAKELAEVEAAVAELNAITATKQEEDIYDTGLFDSFVV